MIFTGLFVAFFLIGAIVFSTYRGSSKDAVTVTVWGTIAPSDFSSVVDKTSLYQSETYKVQYVQKSEESFDSEFVEALASGEGPDLFMLPSEKILKHRNKIYTIPFSVFTERQFKDAFIEGAEIYMMPDGVLALPVSVDPLVMYWNRTIFTNSKISQPPKYWDEFYDLANSISKKDGALNIQQSTVAFGEFSNISHAKDIIVNLAMQSGTPVTGWSNLRVVSVFADSFNKPTIPAEAAINFYTEFSNAAKTSYSWNRSLPNSTNYFLSGDLALYFGFASEARNLQVKNPNLNFDVAAVPVSREGGTDVSFGKFNALAITKSSKNAAAAYAVASVLSSGVGAAAFSEVFNLPPVRRDLLAKKQTDAYKSVFYDSALRSKTWLDPSSTETDSIFKSMIESITSGRARTGEAVVKANREISALLDSAN